MALHESALEELGLAPMWVRRGIAQGAAVEPAPESAADAVVSEAPLARADRDTAGSDETVRARTTGSIEAQSGDIVEPAIKPVARAEAQEAHAPESRRAPPPASDITPPSSDDDFAWFDDLPAEPLSHTSEIEAKADSPAQPSIDTLDWPALEARVSACERCRLCERRTNTVFGVGDREADWMLIGEAPGENEDKQGEPFVGQAGKLLDNMLHSLDLARGTNVYIANVIKCRPPGNRNPEPDEVARCEPYLQRQVALVKPKLIVALGRFAAQSLLKTEASISSLRGRVHEYEGVPVIVTYHPAYLLRSLGDKAKSWQDLCLARDTWRNAAAQGEGPK
ncbi:phage-related DNA polymerase [Paraburkholderia sp. PGU19]|uniref:uracil-DNA glycosylase n=1 Tax=Paraburkholderia sp. PGU19 TaxID=2735434 RepID=UPI0015D99BB4|nr:uracil-DNA glycosylase [Paraburkholderia sp. PGU19]BCF96861.1 phage-related DNA polymerase [Paraburkholderia sp. PGU19]